MSDIVTGSTAMALELTALRAEVERLRSAHTNLQHDIQQTLGRALGYPWFKNDQKNFPGSTEADGVCVGDHVAESLADEAADKIAALRAALSTARATALEEAARVADDHRLPLGDFRAPYKIAAAIRALKEKQDADKA